MLSGLSPWSNVHECALALGGEMTLLQAQASMASTLDPLDLFCKGRKLVPKLPSRLWPSMLI